LSILLAELVPRARDCPVASIHELPRRNLLGNSGLPMYPVLVNSAAPEA
jgi:hypothetical protein